MSRGDIWGEGRAQSREREHQGGQCGESEAVVEGMVGHGSRKAWGQNTCSGVWSP